MPTGRGGCSTMDIRRHRSRGFVIAISPPWPTIWSLRPRRGSPSIRAWMPDSRAVRRVRAGDRRHRHRRLVTFGINHYNGVRSVVAHRRFGSPDRQIEDGVGRVSYAVSGFDSPKGRKWKRSPIKTTPAARSLKRIDAGTTRFSSP